MITYYTEAAYLTISIATTGKTRFLMITISAVMQRLNIEGFAWCNSNIKKKNIWHHSKWHRKHHCSDTVYQSWMWIYLVNREHV